VGRGQLEGEEGTAAARVPEQGGSGVRSPHARGVSAYRLRWRGPDAGGAPGRSGSRKCLPTSGRRLRRKLQGVQCQQHP